MGVSSIRAASLGLLWAAAGCAGPAGAGSARRWPIDACRESCPIRAGLAGRAEPRTRNVILVAVDGVRWQEVFQGVEAERGRAAGLSPDQIGDGRLLLPEVWRRMIDRGIAIGAPGHGAPIQASGPEFISLPGYQEMLSGRPAGACASNHCAPIAVPTLLDDLRERLDGAAPGGAEVALIGSWERLARAASIGGRGIAISVGRHEGGGRERLRVDRCAAALLDEGAGVSPEPGWSDYRPDRWTAALALRYLAAARPRFLFVGLGDTDEFGHAHEYASHLEALHRVDDFVGDLFELLDGMGRYGAETTVLMTTDHGWADDFSTHGSDAPESSRVWLLAAGGSIAPRGLVSARDPHRLADIAPTIRALLGLADDPSHLRAPDAGRPIPELLPELLPEPAALAARP